MEVRDIIEKQNLNQETLASEEVSLEQLHHLQDSLLKGIPFVYLLGECEFYYQKYFINPNVLIPRQETEYLVDLIVKAHTGKFSRLLDLGTGSGVILLSLIKNGVAQNGVGSDVSEMALQVATENARRLGLESRVEFITSDRFSHVEGVFDIIVSNPPYIKKRQHAHLVHAKVDEFEPHQALYLEDEDYEVWFIEFFTKMKNHLRGIFWMEGHELELESLSRICKMLGYTDVKIIQDLSGLNRFLTGRNN
jgi:release factor glutamine methyltransferase